MHNFSEQGGAPEAGELQYRKEQEAGAEAAGQRRFFVRALIFLILLAITLHLLSNVMLVLLRKETNALEDTDSYAVLNEPENTIDLVTFGDSGIYSDISTIELWRSYGITSWDWGEPNQRVSEMETALKKIYRRQTPKLILIDMNQIFHDTSLTDTIETQAKSWAEGIFPVFEYHRFYRHYAKYPELSEMSHCTAHGYLTRIGTEAAKVKKYDFSSKEMKEVNSYTTDQLKKCVEYCEAHGSQVLLIMVPSIHDWSVAKHNTAAAWAEENGYPFLDLNEKIDEIGLDWSCDSVDGGEHLNIDGAKKATVYLADYIRENYSLEDHREDETYAQWWADDARYEEELQEAIAEGREF